MTQIEALKEIAARDGGLLRPQAVIEAARDEASPLHGAFCWDDTEAARRYRIIQAQYLIRSFRIVKEQDGKKFDVPVFVGVSTDRVGLSENNPYRLADDVCRDKDLLACAERDVLCQLRSLRERHSHLKRLGEIWTAIDNCEVRK